MLFVVGMNITPTGYSKNKNTHHSQQTKENLLRGERKNLHL